MSVGGQCEVKNGQCDLCERKKRVKKERKKEVKKEGGRVKVYGKRIGGCEYEEKKER